MNPSIGEEEQLVPDVQARAAKRNVQSFDEDLKARMRMARVVVIPTARLVFQDSPQEDAVDESNIGPRRVVGLASDTTRFEADHTSAAGSAAVAALAGGLSQAGEGSSSSAAAGAGAGATDGAPSARSLQRAAAMAAQANRMRGRRDWKHFPRPEMPDSALEKEHERQVYFRPTGAHALVALAEREDAKVISDMVEFEDEGIYVGVKPRQSQGNYNRLEQRLILEETEGKHSVRWFGRDGAVGNLPDPLRPSLMRPSQWYDPEAKHLKLTWHKARPAFDAHGGAVVEKRYRLDVDIREVLFYDHPRFSEEEYLSRELYQLCERYRNRKELNLPAFYSDRLATLIRAKAELERTVSELGDGVSLSESNMSLNASISIADSRRGGLGTSMEHGGSRREKANLASRLSRISAATQRMSHLRTSIGALRRLRDAEECADLDIVTQIIGTWNRLKGVRRSQGYSSTSAKVIIRFQPTSEREVRERYQREIEEIVAERRDAHEARCEALMAEFQIKFAEFRKRKARLEEERRLEEEYERNALLNTAKAGGDAVQQASTPARPIRGGGDRIGASEHDKHALPAASRNASQARLASIKQREHGLVMPLMPELPEFDEDAVRLELQEHYARVKRRPGADILDPVLTDNHPVTPETDDSLPRGEKSRREALKKLRYHVRVIVNGKAVTRSRGLTLGDTLKLRVSEIYPLQLTHWPDSLEIELVEESSLVNEVITTIPVRVPGTGDAFRTDARPERFDFTAVERGFYPSWERPLDPQRPVSPTRARMEAEHEKRSMMPGSQRQLQQQQQGQGQAANGSEQQQLPNDQQSQHSQQSQQSQQQQQQPQQSQQQKPVDANGNPIVPKNAPHHVRFPTEPTQQHFLRGAVDVHVEWKGAENDHDGNGDANGANGGHNAQGSHLHPPRRMSKAPPAPGAMSRSGHHPSQRRIRDWFRDADMDPNDPRNAAVMRVLRDMEQAGDGADLFRTDERDKALCFPYTSGPEPKRFALLKARAEGSVDAVQVPLFDHLITADFFRPKKQSRKKTGGTDGTGAAGAEGERVPEFVRKLREKELQRIAREDKLDVNDVVNEEPVPLTDFNLGNLAHFFRPRRKLNPARTDRKPVSRHLESCNLLIQITRGYHIPVRARRIAGTSLPPYPGTEREANNNIATHGPEAPLIRPFVEATFLGHSVRTHASDDVHPQWNELLTLPFMPPGNDFGPAALSGLRASVRFDVYDELTIDNPRDDRVRDAVDLRRERRWLGRVEVPFRYLYENVKVEGQFELEKPIVTLGYASDPGAGASDNPFASSRGGPGSRMQSNAGGGSMGGMGGMGGGMPSQGSNAQTTIGLFLTFDPLLARPEDEKEGMANTDNRMFNEYAYKWVTEVRALKQCKGRQIFVLANDIFGRSVCITRYVYPQPPPPEFDTLPKLARFVSLVPYLDDSTAFDIEHGSVWATSEQFLNEMKSGDEEEHGLLLCNYLLYLAKEAYVILGTGFPEGPTTYVLTRDQGDHGYTLWNPSTGTRYSPSDPQCPLKSVGTVFNRDNIWANIQQQDNPGKISWNLHDPSSWRPFFTDPAADRGAMAQEFATVQSETLSYPPTSSTLVLQVERSIDAAIGKAIEGARDRHVTVWDGACSRTLRTLLPALELDRLGEQPLSLSSHLEAMGNFFLLHAVHGYPINQSYTSVEAVTEAVLATGLHRTEDEDVKFARAVYVHPYPCSILSVWVYFVLLKPHT